MAVAHVMPRAEQTSASAHAEPVRDASGYAIFADGELGAAHVMAHRLFDEGRMALGHRLLGRWLEGRSGAGSRWTHLHFHMAVFELALGDWQAAYARYQAHILPAATTGDASTDAPAIMWRLALSAPQGVELCWQVLRRVALAGMQRTRDPFIQLHHILALAGAGDVEGLDRWLDSPSWTALTRRGRLVQRIALALKHCAMGRCRYAATALAKLLPQLPEIGGSRAQHQLFLEIAEWCRRRADNGSLTLPLAEAA